MDTLFCETLQFLLPVLAWNQCRIAMSQEEVLRAAMAEVGLELIDYGSFVVPAILREKDGTAYIEIRAYSVAYRDRAERAAAVR